MEPDNSNQLKDSLPPILSIEQVSDLIGAHPVTVKWMFLRGRIPGGVSFAIDLIRFDRDTVLNWLSNARKETKDGD